MENHDSKKVIFSLITRNTFWVINLQSEIISVNFIFKPLANFLNDH
jgi:hypothetical protein